MAEKKGNAYMIVGAKYRGTEALLQSLPEGEALQIVREPDNKYDRNAVQVWARGQHVGYVPKTQNGVLSTFVDQFGAVAGDYVKALDGMAADASPRREKSISAKLHISSGGPRMVVVD